MIKKIVLGFLLSYFALCGFSQQAIITTYPLTVINENDIVFDRQIINPSILNDTFKFQADYIQHQQLMGYEDSPNDFSYLLNYHLTPLNSSIGVISRFSNSGPIK